MTITVSELEQGLLRQIQWAHLPEPHPQYQPYHFFKKAPRVTIDGATFRTGLCDVCWVAEREHPKGRRFKLDLAWPYHSRPIGVEIQGGIWVGGKHSRGVGQSRDFEKINMLQLDGWIILQYGPDQVKDGSALEQIERAFKL